MSPWLNSIHRYLEKYQSVESRLPTGGACFSPIVPQRAACCPEGNGPWPHSYDIRDAALFVRGTFATALQAWIWYAPPAPTGRPTRPGRDTATIGKCRTGKAAAQEHVGLRAGRGGRRLTARQLMLEVAAAPTASTGRAWDTAGSRLGEGAGAPLAAAAADGSKQRQERCGGRRGRAERREPQ